MAYTEKETAVLLAEETPITYARAGVLAEELGKSHRSVISKIKSLELDYEPKPVAPKRPQGKTKAELVAEVESHFGAESGSLAGLEKATGLGLAALLAVVTESATES